MPRRQPSICASCLIAYALALGPGLCAQTASSKIEFEAASLRAVASPTGGFGCTGGPGTADPELLTCRYYSLSNLVMMAYNLRAFQFSGPGWMDTERYDLRTKIPSGATMEQFRLMQQNLLAERFRLQFHYEKKEMQAYDLIVVKKNPNLKESPEASASAANEQAWHPPMAGPPVRLRAAHRGLEESMTTLARFVSDVLGMPITDATGLKGRYDFTLTWMAEPRRFLAEPPAAVAPDDDPGLTIEGALKDQLGLGLKKKKEEVDVLVIDHAEKAPTEN